MSYSPHQVDEFIEAGRRWEQAQAEAKHLQQLLAAARKTGGDAITIAQISQEAKAASDRAAQLLAAAAQCLEDTRPDAHPPE